MELARTIAFVFALLSSSAVLACPLEIDEFQLARAEAAGPTSPSADSLFEELRPHLDACISSTEENIQQALRFFVSIAVVGERPADLKSAANLVDKKLAQKNGGEWKVYRARIRAVRGHDVFAELENLHGRGALKNSPEALRLLAAARRKAGDIKGAGRIAVEARTAERLRSSRRTRKIARLTATHLSKQATRTPKAP